jgi:hypothetical protein
MGDLFGRSTPKEEGESVSVDTKVESPIANGDTIWVVSSDCGIHTYSFVESHTNYRGEPMMLLSYGKHPRQRNYHRAADCFRTRTEACVVAAKSLRYRAEMCLARAKELEAEAAGIPKGEE